MEELTLAEISLIAGLPQAPSRYSPFVKPTAARAHQEYVTDRTIKRPILSTPPSAPVAGILPVTASVS